MLQRLNPTPTRFIGGLECTYLPRYDVDLLETTGHTERWREDLDALIPLVGSVRYPIRWHRVEPQPGRFDWSMTDETLGHLRDKGVEPIVDLLHHTSYPAWLSDGFRDRRFRPAFVRYATAVAERYPGLTAYTLFNEPFATLFLAGHEALWPPYEHGIDGFVRLATAVLPAVAEAAAIWRERFPGARHVWIDTCEHHRGISGGPDQHAAYANDRRHVLLDLAIGHDLDPRRRPFLADLLRAGGETLLNLPPSRVDVLGLDYYSHSEWWYDEAGARAPSPHPIGFAALAEIYGSRYGVDLMLTETNVRGAPSDRASWLRYTLEQYELARSLGVPLSGYCWYPHVDSCDWDSLLARSAGRVDPVGVLSLQGRQRDRTLFTEVWESAATGTPAADLPAYRFQPPLDAELSGFLPQMDHWRWQDPPERSIPIRVATP
ncbi:MAG TPA: family 1 glycosylhydrolase [Propionibacteriaceae bacterium]|nr:family 1 glycosylhydrolase [Propionibacteriaceae bacterium]